jgi:hypothetical protein
MAITAERLFQAAQLEPGDLGEDVVSPELGDEAQKQATLDWLTENVLPIADAEVSVPLLKVCGYDTVAGFINERFASVLQATRDGWIAKGNALYDGAVLSYGRSEINKSIDSNDQSYDRDSDQDRIQGNQRLEKLLDWASALIKSEGAGSGADGAPSLGELYSQSVRVTKKW